MYHEIAQPISYYKYIWYLIIYLIFDNQEIQTTMTQKELKQLLILCTKNVCFTFSGKTFVQFESVTMGLPLGAVAWYFYGGTWKYISSNLNWIHKIVERICWWHYLFFENEICRV